MFDKVQGFTGEAFWGFTGFGTFGQTWSQDAERLRVERFGV